MTTATNADRIEHVLELRDQTVVVIGGSSGIGLATARRARGEGADVVLTARDVTRLDLAGRELGAQSTATFDATDPQQLERFFAELPTPIDHVMLTAGRPYYAALPDMEFERALRAVDDELLLPFRVAYHAAHCVRPGGSLMFVSGTGARHPSIGLSVIAAVTAALQAAVAKLALELAPIRVNLVAAGFVDTTLSAAIVADGLEARRRQLRTTLPIGRVVQAADVAALAVHLMTNTALTGATYDVDGGQQIATEAWA